MACRSKGAELNSYPLRQRDHAGAAGALRRKSCMFCVCRRIWYGQVCRYHGRLSLNRPCRFLETADLRRKVCSATLLGLHPRFAPPSSAISSDQRGLKAASGHRFHREEPSFLTQHCLQPIRHLAPASSCKPPTLQTQVCTLSLRESCACVPRIGSSPGRTH